MAVPAFIDVATSNSTANSTSNVVTLPTHLDGDLLVVVISLTTGGGGTNPIPDFAATPTGWSKHFNENISTGTAVRYAVFSKIASGEPATVDFVSLLAVGYIAHALSYRGADTNPDAQGGGTQENSTSPSSAEIRTSVADALVIRVMACDDDDITDPTVFPPGHNNRAVFEQNSPGNGMSLGVADTSAPLPTLVPAAVWTLDASEQWGAMSIAWGPLQPLVAQPAVISANAPTAVLVPDTSVVDVFFLAQTTVVQADAPPAQIHNEVLIAEPATVRVNAPPALVFNEMLLAEVASVVADAPTAVLVCPANRTFFAQTAEVTVDAPTAVLAPDLLFKPAPAAVTADAPTAVLVAKDLVFFGLPTNVVADAPLANLRVDLRLVALPANVAADAPRAALVNFDRFLLACPAEVAADAPLAKLELPISAAPAEVIVDAPIALLLLQADVNLTAATATVVTDAPSAIIVDSTLTGPVCADPSVRPRVIANPSIGRC